MTLCVCVCVREGERDRETLCDETVTHKETRSVQYPGKPGGEPGFEVAVAWVTVFIGVTNLRPKNLMSGGCAPLSPPLGNWT